MSRGIAKAFVSRTRVRRLLLALGYEGRRVPHALWKGLEAGVEAAVREAVAPKPQHGGTAAMNWFQGLVFFCGIMALGLAIRIARDVWRHERWRRMAAADYEARKGRARAQARVDVPESALGTHAGAGEAPLGGDEAGSGVNAAAVRVNVKVGERRACDVEPLRCVKCGLFHLGMGTDVCAGKGGAR